MPNPFDTIIFDLPPRRDLDPAPGRVTLRLDRAGEFNVLCLGDSSRQCGTGSRMGYQVTLVAAPKFDANGFLIDHNELHAYFVETYEVAGVFNFPSCEILAMRAVAAIRRLCESHGCELQAITVRVAAAPLVPEKGITCTWEVGHA